MPINKPVRAFPTFKSSKWMSMRFATSFAAFSSAFFLLFLLHPIPLLLLVAASVPCLFFLHFPHSLPGCCSGLPAPPVPSPSLPPGTLLACCSGRPVCVCFFHLSQVHIGSLQAAPQVLHFLHQAVHAGGRRVDQHLQEGPVAPFLLLKELLVVVLLLLQPFIKGGQAHQLVTRKNVFCSPDEFWWSYEWTSKENRCLERWSKFLPSGQSISNQWKASHLKQKLVEKAPVETAMVPWSRFPRWCLQGCQCTWPSSVLLPYTCTVEVHEQMRWPPPTAVPQSWRGFNTSTCGGACANPSRKLIWGVWKVTGSRLEAEWGVEGLVCVLICSRSSHYYSCRVLGRISWLVFKPPILHHGSHQTPPAGNPSVQPQLLLLINPVSTAPPTLLDDAVNSLSASSHCVLSLWNKWLVHALKDILTPLFSPHTLETSAVKFTIQTVTNFLHKRFNFACLSRYYWK